MLILSVSLSRSFPFTLLNLTIRPIHLTNMRCFVQFFLAIVIILLFFFRCSLLHILVLLSFVELTFFFVACNLFSTSFVNFCILFCVRSLSVAVVFCLRFSLMIPCTHNWRFLLRNGHIDLEWNACLRINVRALTHSLTQSFAASFTLFSSNSLSRFHFRCKWNGSVYGNGLCNPKYVW